MEIFINTSNINKPTIEITKSIKLTELEISFIKMTLQNSEFEKGGKMTKKMTDLFEKLHKEILTK